MPTLQNLRSSGACRVSCAPKDIILIPARIEHIVTGLSLFHTLYLGGFIKLLQPSTHHLPDVSWDSYTYPVICSKRFFVLFFFFFLLLVF